MTPPPSPIPLPERALDVLRRQDAPALPLPEVEAILSREGGDLPGELRLLEALRMSDDGPSCVEGPRRRRWASRPLHPHAWVLAAQGESREGSCPGLSARIMTSLRSLARGLENESTLAWARWSRLLEEEGPVRKVLTSGRWGRRPLPAGTLLTTTPLPGRRSGG